MVKLLPCDHEVTGSSSVNSLLQKCRERLRTKDPSGRTLLRTLRKQELRALGLPFFLRQLYSGAEGGSGEKLLLKILIVLQLLIKVP